MKEMYTQPKKCRQLDTINLYYYNEHVLIIQPTEIFRWNKKQHI